MTTLIGYRWKCSDVWSRVVLITRKLPFIILFSLESKFLSSQILKRATLDAFSKVIVIPSCQCKRQPGTGKPVRIRYKNCWWLQRGGSPLPIPNREVKLVSADGTAILWESMSPPFFKALIERQVLFFVYKSKQFPNRFKLLGLISTGFSYYVLAAFA